jgi:hypothetical protein
MNFINAGGFDYCPLAEGDSEFSEILLALEWIVATSYSCHTSLRFGPCHALYHDEYIRYQKAVKYFQMYPLLVYNDPCIKEAITYAYWGLNGNKYLFSYTLVSIVLLVWLT